MHIGTEDGISNLIEDLGFNGCDHSTYADICFHPYFQMCHTHTAETDHIASLQQPQPLLNSEGGGTVQTDLVFRWIPNLPIFLG